jgi:uncharacterized GH25 family protein
MFAVLLGICGVSNALAHDFWLQPSTFWLQPQAAISMTLQVGHGPFRQRSPMSADRITQFEAIAPNGTKVDLRYGLHLGANQGDGDLRFQGAGAYMLVLQTDNRAQSHLPAIRFNDYLSVEGLTPALKERGRTHRMDEDGSECYSRIAKSIVQVGPSTKGSQAQVTRRIGLPLEILPEVSPYADPQSATLPVHIIYEGLALPGALVKLTNLEHDANPVETHLTDQAGRAVFTMPKNGSWLLNVIWTKPLPPSRETDFETVFSSLSFGLPPVRP